ncbi:MAG: hypothetical protein EBR09_16280 [Proteobacteria bacterium]|jgi:hypothetical protein|nr:hypothetical protein [Pseudomonadota bacterium]
MRAGAGLAHAALVVLLFAGVAALAAAQGLPRESLAWVAYVHVLTASTALELLGVRPGRGEDAAARALERVLLVFVEIAGCGAAALVLG